MVKKSFNIWFGLGIFDILLYTLESTHILIFTTSAFQKNLISLYYKKIWKQNVWMCHVYKYIVSILILITRPDIN